MRFSLLLLCGLLISPGVMAAANVQIIVSNVAEVKFTDRATNHASYSEISVRGTLTQGDATVSGLPAALPQTVRLLFRPATALDQITYAACLKMALLARNDKSQSIVVHLFMTTPNNLPSKIEGGMTDTSQNQFVIKMDDTEFSSISCANL